MPPGPALAWLACLLCPALAWSGLGLPCLPCLPCLGLVQQQQPAAFGGRRRLRRRCCCCWTRPRQGGQGRQDRPGPDQAKAGHNRQASQAKAGGFIIATLAFQGVEGGFIIPTGAQGAQSVWNSKFFINTPQVALDEKQGFPQKPKSGWVFSGQIDDFTENVITRESICHHRQPIGLA